MGRITSRGCARNDRIILDFVSCDPVVPGAPTRRDPTHRLDSSVGRASAFGAGGRGFESRGRAILKV